MKNFFEKHKQVIKYLFFGIPTTVVGWLVYFGVLICGKSLAGIPPEDTVSGAYMLVYTLAQITQWLGAVLFAFFTNRKWVFTEAHSSKSTLAQLCIFASGRIITFVLDYVVTFFGALALCAMIPAWNCVMLFGREWNINEIGAKLVAAVLVIIGNYFFSKLLVFKDDKATKQRKKNG